MKDTLKRPVFSGDWAKFEPPWDRYGGFLLKRSALDLLAYIFCSCFPDEGNVYASLVQNACWTYEQMYSVASTIGRGELI